jgi:hypothetical protein
MWRVAVLPSFLPSRPATGLSNRCRIAGIPQISAAAEASQQRIATGVPPHRCSARAGPQVVGGCRHGPPVRRHAGVGVVILGASEILRLWRPVMLPTALRIIGCARMTAN